MATSLSDMLRHIIAFSTLALALAAGADRPIKVVLVGDSTVNDEGGWGPGFRASFGPEVQVVNLALNGRSSKSFRDEGAWAKVLAGEAELRADPVRAQRRGGQGPGARDRSGHHLPRQSGALRGRGPRGRRHSRPGDLHRAPQLRRPGQVQAGYARALCRSGAPARGGTKGGADRSVHADARTGGAARTGGQRDAWAPGRRRANPTARTWGRKARRRSARWPRRSSPASRRRSSASLHELVAWRNAMRQPAAWYSSTEASAHRRQPAALPARHRRMGQEYRYGAGAGAQRTRRRSRSRSAIRRRTPPSTTTRPTRRCDTWRASSPPPS